MTHRKKATKNTGINGMKVRSKFSVLVYVGGGGEGEGGGGGEAVLKALAGTAHRGMAHSSNPPRVTDLSVDQMSREPAVALTQSGRSSFESHAYGGFEVGSDAPGATRASQSYEVSTSKNARCNVMS